MTAASKNKVVMEIQSETRSFIGDDAVKVMFRDCGQHMLLIMDGHIFTHSSHTDCQDLHG